MANSWQRLVMLGVVLGGDEGASSLRKLTLIGPGTCLQEISD